MIMNKKTISIKAFRVFAAADAREDLMPLAEEHHKENPEHTAEQYLGAFKELLNIRRKIARSML